MQTLYIEGIKHSDAKNDVKIKATLDAPGGSTPAPDNKPFDPAHKEKEVETTVYQVDLDVDSLNNNQFNFAGFDKAEDEIEASDKAPKKSGKYIFTNAGFNNSNNDGTPGWADGFDINSADTEDDTADVFKFTALQIELKEPLNPANAQITFTYAASDPAGVTSAGGGGTPDHPYTYTLPSGQLRIWKKDGPGTRKKESVAATGDYVPTGVVIPWSKIASGRTAQLYLEAVRPSGSLGDLPIKIEVTEGAVKCEDKVNTTSVYFKQSSAIVTVAANPTASYALVANRFSALNQPAVTMNGSLEFDPAGVDDTKFPLDRMRVGIMQNTRDVRVRSELFNLQGVVNKAPAPWAAPSFVDVTVSGDAERRIATRMNDDVDPAISGGVDFRPLYQMPISGGGGSLDTILPKPNGTLASTNDTPSVPNISSIAFMLGGVKVFDAAYSSKRIQVNHKFTTWCVGIDVDTRQFYPMKEQQWDLDVDTDIVGNQAAVTIPATNVTIIPVRTPSGNNTLNALPWVFTPTPGAVTVRVVP